MWPCISSLRSANAYSGILATENDHRNEAIHADNESIRRSRRRGHEYDGGNDAVQKELLPVSTSCGISGVNKNIQTQPES